MDPSSDDAESSSREDICIVPLTRLVSLPKALECWEGRARGKHSSAFRVSVGLLSGTLGHAGWVTEGEDDWLVVEAGHVTDDLRSEDSCHSGRANQTGWFDCLHDVAQLLHLLVRMSKWCLVF